MPRCQELIPDRAETTAKEFILFLDKAICNAKEDIQKEKEFAIQKDILYQCFYLQTSKKLMAQSTLQKNKLLQAYVTIILLFVFSCCYLFPSRNMHDEIA